MSGIFGRSALSGDPWDTPAVLDAWSTPATLQSQPAATDTPAVEPRVGCGEGETMDAVTGQCIKVGITSTEVKTVTSPDAAPVSTGKLTVKQALPYVLGAAAAGVLLMVLMKKAK